MKWLQCVFTWLGARHSPSFSMNHPQHRHSHDHHHHYHHRRFGGQNGRVCSLQKYAFLCLRRSLADRRRESRGAPASSRTHNSRIRNSFLASENLQLCRRTEFNLPAISKSSQENGKFSKLRTMRFLILLLFFFWSAEKRFCLSRRTIRAVRNNPPWAEINNVYINCRAHLLKGYPSLRFRELARKYSLG